MRRPPGQHLVRGSTAAAGSSLEWMCRSLFREDPAALERLAVYDRWGKVVAAARWLALRSGCINFLNRAAACCPSQTNNTAKQGMEPGDAGLCRRGRKVRHQMQSSIVVRRNVSNARTVQESYDQLCRWSAKNAPPLRWPSLDSGIRVTMAVAVRTIIDRRSHLIGGCFGG